MRIVLALVLLTACSPRKDFRRYEGPVYPLCVYPQGIAHCGATWPTR